MILKVNPLPTVNRQDGECYGDSLPDECKIPSEFIEPYVQRFLMMCLEDLAYTNIDPEVIKSRLDGVRYFISCYGGIHSEMATNTLFFKIAHVPAEQLKKTAVELFKKYDVED